MFKTNLTEGGGHQAFHFFLVLQSKSGNLPHKNTKQVKELGNLMGVSFL